MSAEAWSKEESERDGPKRITPEVRAEMEAVLKKIIEEAGGLEQMHIDEEQSKRDYCYLSSIREQLRENYPDCWVAVYKGEIVGAGPDLRKVRDDAAARGIPRRLPAVEYITKELMVRIL